jgi:NAD(P)-dependent dehydrogenase (short-subunit alcohol dehydrogenase family)
VPAAGAPLKGKTVVVPLGLGPTEAADLVRRLSEEGASVVLVAREDDAEAGRLAAQLSPTARTAVMVLTGDDEADLDALVEMVAELFP